MNEETKLPEGLELAVSACHGLSGFASQAIDAIRAEHDQRLVLQHHCANLAQRVADLEKERNTTAAHVVMTARQLGDEALQVDDIAVRVLALVAERDAAQQARRDAQALAERYQAERNAAGVQDRREVAGQVRALTAERDKWRNDAAKLLAHSDAQIETAQASFRERLTLDRANRLLTAERNELRRQLAELERKEPVTFYARPVPAIPEGWKLVPVVLTPEMVKAGEIGWFAKERDMSHPTPTEFPEGGPAEACFFAMIAAAPEYKA